MSSSLKHQSSIPSVNRTQPVDPSSGSDETLTFHYRSQSVKVVCTDSYKATIDALLDACPKLLKAPRALIGLSLETSGPSNSQRLITESAWPFFYKSNFRNADAVIIVTILPVPRPAQDNAHYLDVPHLAGHHSDSELPSARTRAVDSSKFSGYDTSSNRSSVCSCQSTGSSDGSFTAEITTHELASPSGPKRSILAVSSAPNLSTQNAASATSSGSRQRHKRYLQTEKALLDKATGYHAEKRRAQLARQIDTTNYYNRLIAKEEKRKAKEAKRLSGSSSTVSSWIGKLF